MNRYKDFCQLIDNQIRNILEKNIIIYGSTRGGDFIRWFIKNHYHKEIKAVIDRWELSSQKTILHLWSLYYIYDENDIIINVTPQNIKEEFEDTGESWDNILYHENQILNLWDIIYQVSECENYPELTFFDWLEHTFKVDLMTTIRRKHTTGESAHGYFPTDFRIFVEGIGKCKINPTKDAVLDIGSGKGSGVIALHEMGFKNIGGIEYTDNIYDAMIKNLDILSLRYTQEVKEFEENKDIEGIVCYRGDATKMRKQLNRYNWFFLFNPFSIDIVKEILNNICRSIKEEPRKVYIFYVEPIGHQLILNTGMFKLKYEIKSDLSDVSYYSYIYESTNITNIEN